MLEGGTEYRGGIGICAFIIIKLDSNEVTKKTDKQLDNYHELRKSYIHSSG